MRPSKMHCPTQTYACAIGAKVVVVETHSLKSPRAVLLALITWQPSVVYGLLANFKKP